MTHNGFTLLETVIAIVLLGMMAFFTTSYLNVSTLSQIQSKSQLQSQITLLQSMILQCKTLSEVMPKQASSANASATLIDQLVCLTSPTYLINGGKGGFVPHPLNGFDPFTATESGASFFITISATQNSDNDSVLQSLSSGYSATQAQLHYGGGKAILDIYLSH